MRRMYVLVAALVLAVVAAQAPASAVLDQDQDWLGSMHQVDLTEIAFAKLAADNAESPLVKQLAADFAEGHQQLDDEVQQVAQQLKATLPSQPNEQQQLALQRMGLITGAAFDQLWFATNVAGHEQALKAAQAEVKSGQHPQAVALANKAVGAIATHLAELKDIAPQLGLPVPQ
ncbi:DUF4142 domain-containing protein [Catellatospora sp. KI3]|uniref:DUF4142 domain-containing protein n=1 Tax=Catellatospora sp. KI3 TaxID=3041620 RepID=UPI002482DCCE|nr:DUF4142 domain-containing protein [Catellatospora sp. KI3]MDI1465919.1 DUF4142 domain-containing protein [Catellatospora sp. KI3]